MDLTAFESALPALLTLLTGQHLLYLLGGVALGMVFGILPAVGGLAGISMVLPFVYGMDPAHALAMLVGLLAVPATADTFSSILIGVPGGAGSASTVIDGFEMAKKGEGARALSAAFIASLIGGLFGAVVLSFAFVVATPILMAVGFAEQLMLIILALTLVGFLTGRNVAKGLASCCIGLLIGTIGSSTATAEMRFTFGSEYLLDGVPLVVVALGAFALPEILDILRQRHTIAGDNQLGEGWIRGARDVFGNMGLVIRCSGLGALLGMLPGMGGGVVGWVAYAHAAQSAKDRSEFGKGDVRGVIGPESSNNAKDAGDLIPTLFLGVPSNGTMALFLAALTIIGLQPGRILVTQHQDVVYLIIWSFAIANVLGAGVSMLLARPIARLTAVPFVLVAPFVLIAIVFAAYQSKSSWGDIVALVIVGVVGLYMKRFGWSRIGLLIGLVMSHNLEAALYRTAQIYGIDMIFRPLSLLILALAAVMLFITFRTKTRISTEGEATSELSMATLPLQLLFLGGLLVFVIVFIVNVSQVTFLANVFPLSVAAMALVFLTICGVGMLRRSTAPGLIFDADVGSTAAMRPLLPYVLLLAALPVLTALIGLWLASVVYAFLFLWRLGRKSVAFSAISALLLGAFLYAVVGSINGMFAQGLLQSYVDLPFPLR